MEIGAGGLRRGDHLPEAEVQAEVGAQEAQGAEVGKAEALGSAVNQRALHQIHQLGNLLNKTEIFQDRGTGREQAVRQNHRRARRLFPAVSLLPRRLLSIRSQHIPVQRVVVVVGSTQVNIPFDLMTSAENFLFAEHQVNTK